MNNKYKLITFFLSIALLAHLFYSAEEVSPAERSEMLLNSLLQRQEAARYSAQKVSKEKLDSLVRVAMTAPSQGDLCPWQFYALDDKALLQNLGTTFALDDAWKTAPAMLLVCGDTTVTDDDGNVPPTWRSEGVAAATHLFLAAEAMRLSAKWLPVWHDAQQVQYLQAKLQMPEGIVPLVLVAVGYAEEKREQNDRWDTDVIHYNTTW